MDVIYWEETWTDVQGDHTALFACVFESGEPFPVMVQADTLEGLVREVRSKLSLTPEDRCGTAMPSSNWMV